MFALAGPGDSDHVTAIIRSKHAASEARTCHKRELEWGSLQSSRRRIFYRFVGWLIAVEPLTVNRSAVAFRTMSCSRGIPYSGHGFATVAANSNFFDGLVNLRDE